MAVGFGGAAPSQAFGDLISKTRFNDFSRQMNACFVIIYRLAVASFCAVKICNKMQGHNAQNNYKK